MALGSLIIQARCGYSDRETVQQITENPYLQYFIGLKEYQLTKPFTPVAMVKFRKRFKAKHLAKINKRIVAAEMAQEIIDQQSNDHDDHQGGPGQAIPTEPAENKGTEAEAEELPENDSEVKPNQGTLILDATCTPADIRFPTDLGLLNEAREKLDEIIDKLHEANGKIQRRPILGDELRA